MTSVLFEVAVLLLAAVIAIPLFRRLRLGAVLGYLAAGIVIGPWVLGVVRNVENILQFSEFGVVLLLFIIGLELQPSRLWVLRRTVFGLGALQAVLTTTLITLFARLLGLPWMTALIAGFGLSLSSTALVLQLLAERKQLSTEHGRSAFGILLFQDLAVLPVLALLPSLGQSAAASAGFAAALQAVKAVLLIAALVLAGRYLLRPLLRVVAETRVSEAFTAAALLIVIGTALLVQTVGLSMALGAFVAGVLLADSEHRHELEADIEPFKGLLLGLFFIAVGMSANLGLVAAQPWLIAGLVVGYMLVKVACGWLIGRLTRHSAGASLGLAFALPAGGEFAFVLFGIASRQHILSSEIADVLVIVVTLSMALSPLLMIAQDRLALRLEARNRREFDTIEERDQRVIIAGYGRVGQIVSRVLRARRIAFTALEVSQAQVDFVRRFGNKIYYGDASRLELLRAAGAERAEVLILAIDDVEASVKTAQVVRENFPQLKIFARVRNRQHAFRLMDIGVEYQIRDTFLSSLDLAAHALEALGSTAAAAAVAVQRFREHDERTLAMQNAVKDDETKVISASREAARQLEQLFESDVQSDESKTSG
ncbi:MAG TPA: monovalent cation:proton antiporter-2 (CPA2) family protein [Steroidobacteraceae bacterium]